MAFGLCGRFQLHAFYALAHLALGKACGGIVAGSHNGFGGVGHKLILAPCLVAGSRGEFAVEELQILFVFVVAELAFDGRTGRHVDVVDVIGAGVGVAQIHQGGVGLSLFQFVGSNGPDCGKRYK